MSSRTKLLLALVGGGGLLVGLLLGRGRSSGQVSAAVVERLETPVTSGPRPLELVAQSREKNPVKVASAELARIAGDIQVVGTVAFHEDHYALVGPLVAGRISRLAAGVGDQIRRGQILAEIESAEVGQARADLVAAKARYSAADANLHRETELADKRISSERERELAHAQWVTEQAGVRAATMRLRAIGLSAADIDSLERGDLAGRVPIRAPIGGTVIERKVTLGQAVERATDAFKLADTSRVWVTLDLYEKDLFRVHVGQEVEIWTESRPGESFRGKVAFIVPEIDQATRTAKVRLEFANPKGLLEAGQLVTARIVADARRETAEVLAVPRSAVEQIEGKTVVFVQTGGGFERRNVLTGASGGPRIEIRQGLALGERVAVEGAFLLKSELLR
jgi:membrane fusion protein, heavy metal efflux system